VDIPEYSELPTQEVDWMM